MSKKEEKVVGQEEKALPLTERGAKASAEIAVILKKYDMALAVNIEGAQPFIETLKPTLIDAKTEEEVK